MAIVLNDFLHFLNSFVTFAKTISDMKYLKFLSCFSVLLLIVVIGFSSACKKRTNPEIPEQIKMEKQGGVVQPVIKVYDTKSSQLKQMPLEEYVAGVVAGEMDGSFPSEALKAQSVLARTYTMFFIANKGVKEL